MNTNLSTLAIIIPCYNEEAVLKKSNEVFLSILNEMKNLSLISHESYLCYVDDGSKDKTWELIQKFIEEENCIQGILFSKNFVRYKLPEEASDMNASNKPLLLLNNFTSFFSSITLTSSS